MEATAVVVGMVAADTAAGALTAEADTGAAVEADIAVAIAGVDTGAGTAAAWPVVPMPAASAVAEWVALPRRELQASAADTLARPPA